MQCVSRAGPSRICVARETVAFRHQDVFERDLEAVELKLAMAAVFLRPHDRNAAQDAPAGLVLVIEKRGQAPARIVGCFRNQDKMRGTVRAGDEPLASAHHIAVVLFLGAREHHSGI